MENEQPQAPVQGRRPRNALDEQKLKLMTEAPLATATKPASLQPAMIANQLRLRCWTNVPSDKNDGLIEARMDSATFRSFFEQLMLIVEGTRTETIRLACDAQDEQGNQAHSVTVVGGRDDQGRVFIGLIPVDQSRPRPQFILQTSSWHRWLDAQNQPIAASLASEIFARGWIRSIVELSTSVLAVNFSERQIGPDCKTIPQGQGQGGQRPPYQGGNQQSGYQKKPWQQGQGGGNFQKKPWQGGQGGGQNNYQKKPWQGGQGGGNGGYQKKPWNNNQQGGQQGGYQQQSAPQATASPREGGGFDTNIPF